VGFDRLTVKVALVVVPVVPSVTVRSLIDRVGTPSSFTIVPIPCASAITACVGPLSRTRNSSFDS